MVGQQLGEGPVEGAKAAPRQHGRGLTLLPHGSGEKRHFEPQIDAAPGRVVFVGEIGQGPRIARGPGEGGHSIGRERFQGHHPRAHRRGEALGQEGSERLVLPLLHVAGRPVVDEDETEEMALRLRDRNRLPERIALGHEGAHL